jgi:carbon storage regulator CsrA
MLILTRKADQDIIINGNIRIRVLSTKGNTVRLGIEAPNEISILRGELVELDTTTQEFDPNVNDSRVCDPSRMIGGLPT